jgi:hypothetical protein
LLLPSLIVRGEEAAADAYGFGMTTSRLASHIAFCCIAER